VKLGSLWPPALRQISSLGAMSLPIESAVRPADIGIDAAEIEREVTELFDALRGPALRYLLSMGLPATDGEEVLQEVFLALFQHLRRGRPRTNLKGWVFRTTHNLGLKRRRRIHQSLASSIDVESFAQPADERPNPEELLKAHQTYGRMRAILNALPERDRSCLSLRAEGLTYREIADVLSISLGAVSVSIQRSLSRLRQAGR
jgi:RNA polymerase sigma-70 factor (ECF subfamily)